MIFSSFSPSPELCSHSPGIQVLQADYALALHAAHVVQLLDAYAQDPAGGGQPLSGFAKTHLVAALAARPQAFSVLAYDGDVPVGLVNCFEGFSTFACRPLVNVHDVVVVASHRGRRVAAQMLQLAETMARQRGGLQAHAGGAERQPQRHRVLSVRWLCALPAGSGDGRRHVFSKDAGLNPGAFGQPSGCNGVALAHQVSRMASAASVTNSTGSVSTTPTRK